MLPTYCYVVLTLLVSFVAAEEKNEPMVAFVCNRPAMYQTEGGWVKDDNTSCLRDPVDILNYCRKVFPRLDIRNVVEASEKVTINNWCAFGHKTCRHQFTVRPFRCLVGPFQSDALLVPEHCIFDHIHDSKLCTSYGEWNKTATQSCDRRSMHLQSFSMLQPCGIDKFNGVEFVCCPATAALDVADDSSSQDVEIHGNEKSPKMVAKLAAPEAVPTTPTTDDVLSAYARNSRKNIDKNGHKWKEHDYYRQAMRDLQQRHDAKISQIMSEWSTARQRVQQLKERDPKAAEKMNKEITARFQKTYDALEVESTMEKKQLSDLHQQRVQSELNEKKRHALDDFMHAIDDSRDPAEILRTLKQYIKVVQKDRLHTINRYKHLRDTDPAQAENLLPTMADHLRTIDQQMNVTLAMLDRVPKYKKKIELQIVEYVNAYHAIDSSVAILMRNLADNPTSTVPPVRDYIDDVNDKDDDTTADKDESSYDENEEETERDERDQEENAEDEAEDQDDDEDEDESDDEDNDMNAEVPEPVAAGKKMEKLPVIKKVGGREDVEQVTVTPVVISVGNDDESAKSVSIDKEDDAQAEDNNKTKDEDVDDEEDDDSKDNGEDHGEEDYVISDATLTKKDESRSSEEDESNDHDTLEVVEPAHVDKSYLSAKELYISKSASKSANNINAAVPIGVTVGVITILVVIVAGVVVMRRRSHRRSLRATVNVRLDPAATPEERHIAAMQMNGYENPTYKYFENSASA